PWPPPARDWAKSPRRSRWASPGTTGPRWTAARRRRTSPARTRTPPPATTASAGFARHATTLLDDLAQIPEQAGGIETGRIARQRRAIGFHQYGAHRVRLLRSPLRQLALHVLAKLPEVRHAVAWRARGRRAHIEQAQPRLVAVEHHARLRQRGQRRIAARRAVRPGQRHQGQPRLAVAPRPVLAVGEAHRQLFLREVALRQDRQAVALRTGLPAAQREHQRQHERRGEDRGDQQQLQAALAERGGIKGIHRESVGSDLREPRLRFSTSRITTTAIAKENHWNA